MGKRVKLRGKYNPTGTKRKKPNLQKTMRDGKKVLSCVECIRKQRKIRIKKA